MRMRCRARAAASTDSSGSPGVCSRMESRPCPRSRRAWTVASGTFSSARKRIGQGREAAIHEKRLSTRSGYPREAAIRDKPRADCPWVPPNGLRGLRALLPEHLRGVGEHGVEAGFRQVRVVLQHLLHGPARAEEAQRSEEHTSELQS